MQPWIIIYFRERMKDKKNRYSDSFYPAETSFSIAKKSQMIFAIDIETYIKTVKWCPLKDMIVWSI
ncbi:MAG: hypothetical protein ABS903_08985 [Solibacillus sp.]